MAKHRIEEDLKNTKQEKIYLNSLLKDCEKHNDIKTFLFHLRIFVNSMGGIGKLSKKTKLARESIYRALSPKGNPSLKNFLDILHALGLFISLKFVKKLRHKNEKPIIENAKLYDLTPMEIHILNTIKDGKDLKEASRILKIGFKTTQYHLTAIYSKLNVKNKNEAIYRSIKSNIIPID